jgi:hypothetical protein
MMVYSTYVHYATIVSVVGNNNEPRDVFSVLTEDGRIVLTIDLLMFIGLFVVAGGALAWRILRSRTPNYELVEAELAFAGLAKVTIRPNRENIQIAHQAWVELATRKAALPFEDDDVIIEVYESYYQLFGRLRDLTKAIPAHQLRRCRDTKYLVSVMVRVLNYGLRPHLTRWQARFILFDHWHNHDRHSDHRIVYNAQ